MRLVISIATMDSRERLRECLESIPAACGDLDWSAVVIDNCSRDDTGALVRRFGPPVQLISNGEPMGFGANHNQVLRRILAEPDDGACVLILNDDTRLSVGSICALVKCLQSDPSSGAVAPEVIGADGVRQAVAFRSASQRANIIGAFLGRSATREERTTADWLNGCCLLIPLRVLRTVGVFDERFFMYAEDVDLTLRIRDHGYRLWQCGASQIVHYGAATTSQPSHAPTMQLQAQRSFYLLLCKHRGRRVAGFTADAMRLAHLTRGSAQLVLGLLRRDQRRHDSGRARLALARYDPRRAVFPDRERSTTR